MVRPVAWMAWNRVAVALLIVAVVAGLVGLIAPSARSGAMVASLVFGIGGVGTWLRAQSLIGELERDSAALETRVEQLQGEVRRHRDALDDLAEGLEIGIFLVDQNLRVLYANSLACDLFQTADPRGQTLLSVVFSNDVMEMLQKVVADASPVSAEMTLRQPEERIVRLHAWQDSSNKDRYFLSIHDISDLRRLERVRRDFVANVSHELRTPMTTIRAMAETLEEGTEDEEFQRRYLGRIIKEVDRLTHITDDLLTLSIADSGNITKTDCNAAELVRSIVQQLMSKAEAKGLHLSYQGPDKLPMRANETQLSQIALNLVDNAINYTSEGSVVVRMEDGGSEINLVVEDTGIGIGSEHLSRVFERFYRVDKGRSRASGGTGLGLSIVRHLVEGHGGRVSVQSELNKGSTFAVVLPKD